MSVKAGCAIELMAHAVDAISAIDAGPHIGDVAGAVRASGVIAENDDLAGACFTFGGLAVGVSGIRRLVLVGTILPMRMLGGTGISANPLFLLFPGRRQVIEKTHTRLVKARTRQDRRDVPFKKIAAAGTIAPDRGYRTIAPADRLQHRIHRPHHGLRAVDLERGPDLARDTLAEMDEALGAGRPIVAHDGTDRAFRLEAQAGVASRFAHEVLQRGLILVEFLRLLSLALRVEAVRRDRQQAALTPAAARAHIGDSAVEHLRDPGGDPAQHYAHGVADAGHQDL